MSGRQTRAFQTAVRWTARIALVLIGLYVLLRVAGAVLLS